LFGLKALLIHPHLSPLPSRERKQKVPSPLEGEVRMRGIIMDEILSSLIYSCNMRIRTMVHQTGMDGCPPEEAIAHFHGH